MGPTNGPESLVKKRRQKMVKQDASWPGFFFHYCPSPHSLPIYHGPTKGKEGLGCRHVQGRFWNIANPHRPISGSLCDLLL